MKKVNFVTVVLVLLLSLLTALPAGAVTNDLELEMTGEGLKLTPSGVKLFDLTNLLPGDTETARVTIKNSYSRDYELWLKTNIKENADPGLLEKLELTILKDGATELYSGSVSGLPASLALGSFSPSQVPARLVATVQLPGPETGNDCQGLTAELDLIFTGRTQKTEGGDYTDDPAEEEEKELEVDPEKPGIDPDPGLDPAPDPDPEMPKTGQTVPSIYYVLGGLALVAGTLQLVRKPRRHP